MRSSFAFCAASSATLRIGSVVVALAAGGFVAPTGGSGGGVGAEDAAAADAAADAPAAAAKAAAAGMAGFATMGGGSLAAWLIEGCVNSS